MRFYSETLGLPESSFPLLRDLILERTGMFYENGKRDILADKLSPLVIEKGFSSFLDYYYFLKYDDSADVEWRIVFDALSVPETYFWRESDQIRALVDIIAPQFFSQYQNVPLKIWSAACATGEEPLTIALALNEAGWLNRAPVEIYGSDASARAIEKAKQGVFRERSFRSLKPELREKYFNEQNGLFKIAPEVHTRVKFTSGNLMEEKQIAHLANAHVIFCRNVFIYFSEAAIKKTIQIFFKYMPSPGYLFVGAAESLLKLTTDFELKEIGDAFCYVK